MYGNYAGYGSNSDWLANYMGAFGGNAYGEAANPNTLAGQINQGFPALSSVGNAVSSFGTWLIIILVLIAFIFWEK